MKTPAERQAAYRQRHLKDIDGQKSRVNLIIHHHAKLALARLASHHGVTQGALLERLLLDEQRRVVASLDSDASTAYHDRVTP